MNSEQISNMTNKINEEMDKGIALEKLVSDRDKILYKLAFFRGVTTGLQLSVE
jgi:hypothetical protein